uniref:Uncharacterized protein n=1 Tax=Myoviridae sp. ctMb725 TaxID=2825088 RepID=A0A8S5PVV4_9CAUD|nr:MAG TPA: hypothetical protein [Myoviridae sp. ctMb725]
MDPYTQAFIIAAVDIKVEQEKKEAAKAKRKK